MKKAAKILAIISAVILLIGVISLIATRTIVDDSNLITALFSIFGAIIIQILILSFTLGSIALIWLIFGLVVFIRRLKTDEKKWKDIVAIVILSIPIIFAIIVIINMIVTNN